MANRSYTIAPENDVVEIERTCTACPAQWEGKTRDNRPVYIRYRYGYLSVQIGKPGEELMASLRRQMEDGTPDFFGEQIGEDLDGFCELSDVRNALGERLRITDKGK